MEQLPAVADADLERRFSGLRRLYGEAGYERVRAARIAVVGLGGVGSWAVEALARSGVRGLVLIDFDHVAESNVNRQIQALTETLGMAKVQALQQRIAGIHPGCTVQGVEEFVDAANWPRLLGDEPVDAVIDACDQSAAKVAVAAWALASATPFVSVGAAGGKQLAQRVEVDDLAQTTHDPLLATLRQRLRRLGAARQGPIGLRCVFSRESVAARADACASDGSLSCQGYGSTVAVTATFGFVAAGEALRQLMARPA
jgi:tRNA A37 threonylcarbamoyladenosine dehydratase